MEDGNNSTSGTDENIQWNPPPPPAETTAESTPPSKELKPVTPLDLKSNQLSCRIPKDDEAFRQKVLRLHQWLSQDKQYAGQAEFIRDVICILLEYLEKGTINITVAAGETEISNASSLQKEIKTLRKSVKELTANADASKEQTDQLQLQLQNANTQLAAANEMIEQLKTIPADENKLSLDTTNAMFQAFMRASERRVNAKLSSSTEDFIIQLFSLARASQDKKHLLYDN